MTPYRLCFLDFFILSLLCSFSVHAHPLTTPSLAPPADPKFLSLALTAPPVNNALKELQQSNITQPHAYIIHQQHLNHALSRFAKMTNRSKSLTREILVNAMNNRIGTIPKRFRGVHWMREPQSGDNVGLSIWGQDLGYIATAQLGTPPRDFRLLVDSGSADLWVGGEGCESNDGGDSCGPHPLLGPSSSSSFAYISNVSTFDETNPPWILNYVTGSVSGVLVQDDVTIGGVKIQSHAFGAALRESNDFTRDDIPFDGLLGLAKKDVSQQRLPPLLSSLYNASLISAPIAAYKLPRSKDHHNPATVQGELTIGALNRALYDPRTLVQVENVNPFGYFGVQMGGVVVGGKDMGWSNRTGLVDSGTVLVVAPQMDVDIIHSNIPGAVKSPSDAAAGEPGTWSVPCDMKTRVGIKVGGRTFELDPRDVAMWPVDNGSGGGNSDGGDAGGTHPRRMCVSGISPGTVGPFHLDTDWMLGSVFLKNVYFATDEEKDVVLMARLK
ncbi:hypothetical protein CVT24_008775 [Panaeolus cyanescens]|uniref:Peptidase A1 domain-containing protein n=1 Tax=Panaeolus cyanescens TaxID=181874 RepID=A0A409VDN5_9AGAR|nr:hypothetical protein CVT24_008775 [Panaeolus cyanescens]